MGCDAPSYRDPFRATGETIAMSGGNGGAAAACFTCHGLEGEGDGEVSPRLAGLDPGPLPPQLAAFATGRRPPEATRAISRRRPQEGRPKGSACYQYGGGP